jgi:aryl-alcohol dehydrogenase-like predicted oxidoreductase
MRYTLFGRTGLRVSELALGTGTFGTAWGWGADAAESRAVFDRFVGAGGTLVDTADVYQFGQAETILADLIAADRDHLVLASKYSLGADPAGGVSRTGNSRKAMVQSLEATLRRLNTDRLDLYWVHAADGATPVEEIVRGLDDLARAGKVLYGGLSDFPAWRVSRAATMAELRGWAPVAGLQVEYSLVERTAERELLPMAQGLGLGVTLWSPLGGGVLTGKQRRGEDGRHSKGGGPVRHTDDRVSAILDAVEAVARAQGATPAQVALAWVRAKAAAASGAAGGPGAAYVPILGARTLAQLDDNLGALDLHLDPGHVAQLDAVSAVAPGFPHEMLGDEQFRHMITGGKGADLAGARRVAA